MMKTGRDFKDLGEAYLDSRDQQRLTRQHVERLEALGYAVTLAVRPTEAAPVT